MFDTTDPEHAAFPSLIDFARNVIELLSFSQDLPPRAAVDRHYVSVVSVNSMNAQVKITRATEVGIALSGIDNLLSGLPTQRSTRMNISTDQLRNTITQLKTDEAIIDPASRADVAVIYLSTANGTALTSCYHYGCGDRYVNYFRSLSVIARLFFSECTYF